VRSRKKNTRFEAEKTKETDKDKVAFNDSSVSTSVSKEDYSKFKTSSKSIAHPSKFVPAQQNGLKG